MENFPNLKGLVPFCLIILSSSQILLEAIRKSQAAPLTRLRNRFGYIPSCTTLTFHLPQNARTRTQFSRLLWGFRTRTPLLHCPITCSSGPPAAFSEWPFPFAFPPAFWPESLRSFLRRLRVSLFLLSPHQNCPYLSIHSNMGFPQLQSLSASSHSPNSKTAPSSLGICPSSTPIAWYQFVLNFG